MEGLLSTLFFLCVKACYKMYYTSYVPALLMCCIITADTHRNGVMLWAEWRLLCHSIQINAAPHCWIVLVVCVHCDTLRPQGLQFWDWGDWPLSWRAKLLSSFFWTFTLFPLIVSIFVALYPEHYNFCWPLLL